MVKNAFIFLFTMLLALPAIHSKATGLSISESVVADPEKELAESQIVEEEFPVFGYNLFKGHFRDIQQPGFNEEYIVNIGDIISIRIWGAIEYAEEITVDTQGNIFLPKVGTVKVLGVKNKDLVDEVKDKIKRYYKDMVFCYANITNYQPITVFVTGNVNSPGLYKGMSSDSVLQYIDRAGGIAMDFGSFRNIEAIRGGNVAKKFDLYSFLVSGQNELFQFQNGDVISVNNLMHQISVKGDVKRPYKFEFSEQKIPFRQLVSLAMLKPEATNFTITRWQRDNQQKLFSGSLKDVKDLNVMAGDTVEFFSDHTSLLNKISVTGEHDGLTTILVPKEETLGDVLEKINLNPRSNPKAVQVFRKSVAEKQKELLLAHLDKLESVVLTTASVSEEESRIRSLESKAYMNFIERARQVEPKGQIVINEKTDVYSIYLEEGDQIYIPTITNLATVQGEVSIPGTHTFVEDTSAYDYIELSGGLTERANDENILVVSQNGTVKRYESTSELKNAVIQNGDSVLVLPKVTGKNIQLAKSITQIMYQIAVSVGVLIGL
jgi:protein involved in polysaccharide export with SLBB domain